MPVNHKKLLRSKWTAVAPTSREKHFMVVRVTRDQEDPQKVLTVDLEAVLTRRRWTLPWRDLGDSASWRAGWL
ncbi:MULTISPECIES: TIGR02450 family Trp-rich protein [Gulbenkiania]|uniref:TIGR02450 family Trp-rich protein n=2 Tax=Gulbenkiania TaxID=397456 RepID=A0A0K6GX31_9NEIS|nr:MULTISPECIES: TIGR02450 family Trp-rich protein [Gulbenkiania]TCW33073.1 tryptophan-rich hypothetical protein [Gulbenkiania mobilis]CUA83120.1 tryptophan-rich conserved hypothetical protein [Gulbenkiania indica]